MDLAQFRQGSVGGRNICVAQEALRVLESEKKGVIDRKAVESSCRLSTRDDQPQDGQYRCELKASDDRLQDPRPHRY